MQVQRKTLTQLSIPICFETLFYMLSGMIDTLMLSSVSDQAVGAVGTANTYISVFIIMFGVISSGMVAVMTQNIGAGKTERIPLGFRTGLKLSEFTALPFVMLYFIFSRQMMGLFLGAESVEAISAGMAFLKIVSPWYFMIAIKLMTDGIIRGSGAMVYFVVATVPDLILRIGFALVLTKSFGSTGIWMAWPFGWIVATTLTLIFYRKLGYKNDKSSDL